MKNPKITIRGTILFVSGLILSMSAAFSQSAGTLTFTANTYAPSDTWGNQHVLAVWLENTDNPSVFIKTNAKFGNEDDHLTTWIEKSGSNLVDAVTGATREAYDPVTVTWNGTDVNGTVVADGSYNIWIEMGWGSNKVDDHAVASFAFNKGPVSDYQSYPGAANFTNVMIEWIPVATLVDATENFDHIIVFPNPTNGMVRIDFKKELPKASIVVTNAEGKTLIVERDVKIGVGTKEIDLSTYPNGMYLINIESGDLQYIYKVLMKR